MRIRCSGASANSSYPPASPTASRSTRPRGSCASEANIWTRSRQAASTTFPVPTYVAGFLRTYANYLGLDGEEMVRMYKDETGGALVRQNLNFPIPRQRSAPADRRRMIIGALLVAVIALALWYAIKERQFVDLDLVPPVPAVLAQSLPGGSDDTRCRTRPAEAGAADPETFRRRAGWRVRRKRRRRRAADSGRSRTPRRRAPRRGHDEQSAAVEGDIRPLTTVAPTWPRPKRGPTGDDRAVRDGRGRCRRSRRVERRRRAARRGAGQDAATATAGRNTGRDRCSMSGDSSYVPRVYGRTNANSRVEIRAIDTSWVQIEAPGNQVLLTRVLLPGDVYRVPNGDHMTLKTGNAGGLELRVDGTLIEPLGEPGMVIKDVLLDPEALLRE